jgi:hypothetical protein
MPLARTRGVTSSVVVRAPLTKYVSTSGKGAKLYTEPSGVKHRGGLLNGTIITIYGNTSADRYPRIHSVNGKPLTNQERYIEATNLSDDPPMPDDLESAPKPALEPAPEPEPVVSRGRSRTPPISRVQSRHSQRSPGDVAQQRAWELVKAVAPPKALVPIEEVGYDEEAAEGGGMNKESHKKNFKRNKTRKKKQKKRKSKKRTKKRRSKYKL